MFEKTLDLLQDRDTGPHEGSAVIREWVTTLKGTDNSDQLSQTLQHLYDELANPKPDSTRVKHLLTDLSEQTGKIASQAGKEHAETLKELAERLRAYSIDIDRI
ncbi:hypothetical protein GCM10023187_11540 [Nibrella viscosa]|uniref:Uncharacterized protein n=2 Tax=Nibrella viscosa TaxID=1084524 RepID=A0ABP8K3B0_9BACT